MIIPFLMSSVFTPSLPPDLIWGIPLTVGIALLVWKL